MRAVLVHVRLVLLTLRSCGGHIDMMFGVMCISYFVSLCVQMKCYTLLCTPFRDIISMHATHYACQLMHACLLRLVHIYKAVSCSLYYTNNSCIFSTLQLACRDFVYCRSHRYEYTASKRLKNIKTACFGAVKIKIEDRDQDCLFLPRSPKRSRLPFVGQSFQRIDRHWFRRQSPSLIYYQSVWKSRTNLSDKTRKKSPPGEFWWSLEVLSAQTL